MSRLTKRISIGIEEAIVYTKGEYENTTVGEMRPSEVREVMRKLADYEDLEEKQGMKDFKENELIIYQNGDRFEIGRIKRLTEDGAFVYYHSGETASKTPYDCMHKLINNYCVIKTNLGGEMEDTE